MGSTSADLETCATGEAFSTETIEEPQFLTHEKVGKTAVVLDIDHYEKLLEDLDDLAVIPERRGEETIPHDEFKKSLKRHALSH